jgi:hypothetical protein
MLIRENDGRLGLSIDGETNVPKAMESSALLRALNKVGIQATPGSVQELRDSIAQILQSGYLPEGGGADGEQLQLVLAQADELLAEMQAMKPASSARPSPSHSPTWDNAAGKDLSDAAVAALHDALQRRHRRGAKAMRRPRWSKDEIASTSDAWGIGDLTNTIKRLAAKNPGVWRPITPAHKRTGKAQASKQRESDFLASVKRAWAQAKDK